MPENEQAVAVAPPAPCGACRTLRRRCLPGCVFAPYFTAEDFAAVHGVFGASNVCKMLERVELPDQRRVAAATLVEEARARARDPTFGRISYLRILQEVNDKARAQVDEAREEIAREFGALAANEPVDVAAAAPAARMEARAQVDAALKHAREQDARLIGVRKANEVRWRELHQQPATGKHDGNGKGPDVVKRHRVTSLSEQKMLILQAAKRRSSRPDERSHHQMAAAEAEREKAQLMRQAAAPAKQHGHQQMSESASREETMRSVQAQAPAAAPQHHHDSAGQPRHADAGDDAAGRTPGQGSTSVLLQAMRHLAGAGDEPPPPPQQQLMAQHAENEHGAITLGRGGYPDADISQEVQQLQELFGMEELARMQKQQAMRNVVMMTQMGQWHAAAAGDAMDMEQDVTMTTTTQQITNAAWQQQDQEMPPQEMEEASTAEIAMTTGNMSQQFAWGQQYYHDPAAAVHHASPWHHQMSEAAHHPAAASAAQVASEQDMLLLLQHHQAAAAEELLSAGGSARQFGSLAAQYDDTELTLGYGHPGMHQQVAQVAGVQDMNSRQLAAGAQQLHHQQQHALGNGHADGEIQALMQDLAAILMEGTIRKQGVATGAGQWGAAAAGVVAREQDVMVMPTMTRQSPAPDAAWILEMLERIEKAATPDLDKRLQIMSRHAQKELGVVTLGNGHPDGSSSSSTQGILQAHESFAMAGMESKLEILIRKVVAAERAREQEMIAQQAAAAAQQQQQYSGTELGVTLGNGHQDGSSSTAMAGMESKLEMAMRKVVAAERAREQEMIAQQAAAAAAQQQQQYSGTELDISLGQGHPSYWHQPTVQEMLQEQQLAYANGEHGGGPGATMAFLGDQQTQPNGHQMDSPLPPLPPSLGQLHAQASHQQRTDGGGQGLNSDLPAYLHH